jgi:peptide/nickel transport system permease protein
VSLTTVTEQLTELRKSLSPQMRETRKRVRTILNRPLSVAGLIIVMFYAALAFAAPLIAPPPVGSFDPYSIPKTVSNTPLPPSLGHVFGTSGPQYYCDVFYGVVWGSRLTQIIALSVVAISLIVGIIVGAIAGYFGGYVDEALMRVTDVFFALPGLVLAMALILAMGRSVTTVIIAVAIVWWPGYARLLRGEFLRIKNELYVEAARALGVSDLKIIFKHIVPNAIFSVLVVGAMDVGTVVLVASSLGFLGVGAVPGTAEWGVLISVSRNWLLQGAWWSTLFPGIAIFTFVLGWTLLGDGLRDILDPRTVRGL